jgi:hypothetical protein
MWYDDAREIVMPQSKTLAQQLLEDDKEEDERLFAMIADEVTDPIWSPIIDQFPSPPRSSTPHSVISTHSRSSSRSSNSSAGLSFSSSDTFDSSNSFNSASSSTMPGPAQPEQTKMSRRERARQARVFVDTSKVEVTPYDGGKTTVLTGGVMLGAKTGSAASAKVNQPTSRPASWRFR